MTDVVRLTMVSHAMTDAMAAGRFPADEPLNAVGHRQTETAAGLTIPNDCRQFCGPERRSRQTARLLGLDAVTEPQLADLDYGHWQTTALTDVPGEDLTAWLNDPARTPHGGESIVNLIDRVAGWLASLTDNTFPIIAVTHPAVIRAAILTALAIPPKSFWRIDIAPVSRTVLHFRENCWTLRL